MGRVALSSRTRAQFTAGSKPAGVYVFKVVLEPDPKIWRRIAVLGRQNLHNLHEAIYAAFDRYDEHLYSFYFPKRGTIQNRRRWLHEAIEYTHPYNAAEPHPWTGEKLPSAKTVRIDALRLKMEWRFKYLFDFGDQWWHDLTVEQVSGHPELGKYPRVIEKHGRSPAQCPPARE